MELTDDEAFVGVMALAHISETDRNPNQAQYALDAILKLRRIGDRDFFDPEFQKALSKSSHMTTYAAGSHSLNNLVGKDLNAMASEEGVDKLKVLYETAKTIAVEVCLKDLQAAEPYQKEAVVSAAVHTLAHFSRVSDVINQEPWVEALNRLDVDKGDVVKAAKAAQTLGAQEYYDVPFSMAQLLEGGSSQEKAQKSLPTTFHRTASPGADQDDLCRPSSQSFPQRAPSGR